MKRAAGFAPLALGFAGLLAFFSSRTFSAAPPPAVSSPPAAKAAMTVSAISPIRVSWPVEISAGGSIHPWREAIVSSEASGLKIIEIFADEGQPVQKGDLIARLSSSALQAELSAARAAASQAKARLAEAADAHSRAKAAAPSGAVSPQALVAARSAERHAAAALEAAAAHIRLSEARLAQTEILAPASGSILSRSASLGMAPAPGQELFRILEDHRLEWRALVPQRDAAALSPGAPASLRLAGSSPISATLRQIAPLPDPASKMAIARFDLPPDSPARIGVFAHGSIRSGSSEALALPLSALVSRDGSHYAHEILSDGTVAERKAQIGRSRDGLAEILSGVSPGSLYAESGGAFLHDGDPVRAIRKTP